MAEEIPEDGFWYVSVGGNPTEVARISGGKMYSPGCADPHDLEGVELIERLNEEDLPLPRKERLKQERAWKRQMAARGGGYRTFP